LQAPTTGMFYFCSMITDDEEQFMQYWEANRMRRKRGIRQLAIGLPLSVVLVFAIFANFLSGWYPRAEALFRADTSIIFTVLIAVLAIVVFTTIFSIRHKWDINEQRYQELKGRRGH
jgi:membrane protein YdbS with pleckstrin-like domain